MSGQSSIEWTDVTWNPVTGCDRVSPGCAHCYALELAERLKAMGQPKYQRDGDPKTSGPGFGVTLHEEALNSPLRWKKPKRIFVNSMSDLFHEAVPYDFIGRVFSKMAQADWHTFQVLTKRPERMRDVLLRAQEEMSFGPLPNVWLGVSIENRRFVHRADLLRQTPAAVRFISAEPLLGPLVEWMVCGLCGNEPDLLEDCDECEGVGTWPLMGGLELDRIDWLIAGGESGPKHRPIRSAWVRDLRDAATLNGTAFFLKQWGGRTPKAGGRELDGRTWSEFPEPSDSRVCA